MSYYIKIDNLNIYNYIYILHIMDSKNIIINNDTDESDNYWQTQAMLVMNNLNLSDKNNNIFPVKYSVKSKITSNYKVNNLELMEDLSI